MEFFGVSWKGSWNVRENGFRKSVDTLVGILVRKLYLNLQLCSSVGIKVLCFTSFFDKSQTVEKDYKKFRDQKKLNFEKRSKTFLGTLVHTWKQVKMKKKKKRKKESAKKRTNNQFDAV